MKKIILLVLCLSLVLEGAVPAMAKEHKKKKAKEKNTGFAQLKSLAGAWEGIYKIGDKNQKASVEFILSPDSHRLIERLVLGEQRIEAVYYEKNGKVYYSRDNQPELALTSADLDQLNFSIFAQDNIQSNRLHVRSVVINWMDENNMTESWGLYRNGYPIESIRIILTSVNPRPPRKKEKLKI